VTLTPNPEAEIDSVGETGLTPDEEYLNRERKYSVNGVDVRKFSTSATGGLEPQNDPYYGRKSVSSTCPRHSIFASGLEATDLFQAN
jgi:hypothetical protein